MIDQFLASSILAAFMVFAVITTWLQMERGR